MKQTIREVPIVSHLWLTSWETLVECLCFAHGTLEIGVSVSNEGQVLDSEGNTIA